MSVVRPSTRRSRRLAVAAGVALVAVAVTAGPAWAPSTNDKRIIKITANTATGAQVKETNISLQVFMTADGIENRSSASAPTQTGDRSLTTVMLRDAAGTPLAVFSAALVAESRLDAGYASHTTVDSSLDPPSSGRAHQVGASDVRWHRLWHGRVTDAAGKVVVADDVSLDHRFRALAPGLVATQTVVLRTDDRLSIDYALGGDFDGDGITDVIVASGTATATMTLTTSNTYTGHTTVSDR